MTKTDRLLAAAVLTLAVIVGLTFWARHSLQPHGIGDAIEIFIGMYIEIDIFFFQPIS